MSPLRNRGGVGMVLINATIAKSIPALRDQFGVPDPVAHLKLFTVTGWQWFVLGLDAESLMAWCYVVPPNDDAGDREVGCVDLRELASLKIFNDFFGVERDVYFKPQPLSKLVGGEA
jgi:hypothetical protein